MNSMTLDQVQEACELFEDARDDKALKLAFEIAVVTYGRDVAVVLVIARIRRRFGIQLIGTLPRSAWSIVEGKLRELDIIS